MKRFFSAIAAHILDNREVYLFPLLALLLIVGALEGIPLLTGRAVKDSPAAVIGFFYNFVGVIVAALATGIIQRHLIGYRTRTGYDHFDAICTIVLLALFSYFCFR